MGNKIREITAWLERRERHRRSEDSDQNEKESIVVVCDAVRQLLYDCGNELGWCFTENQVTEARYKQKAGLEDVLSKYYSKDALKMCFVEKSSQSRDPAYSSLPSSTNEEYKDDESNTISDQT